MSNTLVSIVIVSQGVKDYLRLCLDSLLKQVYSSYEIIVIDNSLDSEFSRLIKEDYPQARLYSSGENLFYCQALNKGIALSSGEFIFCLNDDVVLDKDFLTQALKGFGKDSKIGMVSAKVLRADGKTIDSTGLFLSVWRTAGERGHGLIDTGRFEREEYIFGVNGAVAFYRRQMLEEIKIGQEYFDPDFHIFYEDLDMAWRAQRAGWRGYYIPQAIAYHARGATVRRDEGIGRRFARHYLDDDLCADLMKNRWLAIIKNETWLGFLSSLPFVILYDCAAAVYLLFFRPKALKKLVSGVLKCAPSALGKRRLLSSMFFKESLTVEG
ncbi:MAG: glycosyltransferase family 2 protein [Candidatus Omnitrophota bacterium]